MHCIRFNYTNHRGEDHSYVMMPETIEYTAYGDGPLEWCIKGHCRFRDGQSHTGLRSFKLKGMRDIEDTDIA